MRTRRFLMSALFTLILCANFAEALMPTPTEVGVPVMTADVGRPKCKWTKFQAHTDSAGNFLGCWGQGENCAVTPKVLGYQLTFSSYGIHLQ